LQVAAAAVAAVVWLAAEPLWAERNPESPAREAVIAAQTEQPAEILARQARIPKPAAAMRLRLSTSRRKM
jgi:hypothetical protein